MNDPNRRGPEVFEPARLGMAATYGGTRRVLSTEPAWGAAGA